MRHVGQTERTNLYSSQLTNELLLLFYKNVEKLQFFCCETKKRIEVFLHFCNTEEAVRSSSVKSKDWGVLFDPHDACTCCGP